jgi:ArsR family transcriptional regulator, arsenate/arsenite/antimonite-responsive transcriptional repressor
MDASQAIVGLGALAHDTRLAAFRLLVQRGPDGLPAGVIVQSLGLPPSSLTFHLQQLLHAGLITQRRVSRQIIYATDFSTMNSLMSYLTENCCGGTAACSPVRDPSVAGEGVPDQRRVL